MGGGGVGGGYRDIYTFSDVEMQKAKNYKQKIYRERDTRKSFERKR